MENLISIIVPVYNSAQYIFDCVESVLEQTYPAFEIILIEDGSKDSSLVVCEMFCKKDKRIRLISQEHSGVSAARNRGIEEAKGNYLLFLDSDDMIHPQLLESYHRLQEETQAAMVSVGLQYGKGEEFRKNAVWKQDSTYIPGSFYLSWKHALRYIDRPLICSIGGKMISRKAIDTLRFKEGLSHSEDMLFIYQLLANGADMAVLRCNWYYYRMHESNASNVYSPETCRKRYWVKRYICDNELKNGRWIYASLREMEIVGLMIEWYEIGRNCQDTYLIKYIKVLAKKERKRKIFYRLNIEMKIYFYVAIYCYPLYKIIHKARKVCVEILPE